MVPDFQQWKPQWDFVVQGKYTMEGGKRDQTSKNLGEMHHGAITLTDRHPFLISMQKEKKCKKKKKNLWVFEGRKRQPFIFCFECSWSGDSTSFWKREDDEESKAFA